MSKDSRLLMYASFNDSLVNEMRSSWYGDDEDLYPGVRSLRYPKVRNIFNIYIFCNGHLSLITWQLLRQNIFINSDRVEIFTFFLTKTQLLLIKMILVNKDSY